MSKKEELAKIFASGSKVPSTKLLRELSFMEGWDACLKYLGEIPWDQAMDEICKLPKDKIKIRRIEYE